MFQIKGKQIRDNSIIISGTNGLDNKINITGDWTVGSNSLLTQKEITDFVYSKEYISKEYVDLLNNKFDEFTSGYHFEYTDITYDENISSTSGVMDFVIPAGYKVSAITIEEIAGGGGDLLLGSTSGGDDILLAVVNPYDLFDCNIGTFNINERFYSFVSDTPLYLTLPNWSYGTVKIYFTFQRVSGIAERDSVLYAQQSAITVGGVLSDPVPTGYKVDGIVIEETSGTGGGVLSLGSSAGAVDILDSVVVNPSDLFDCNISSYNIGKKLFSMTADTPVYLTLESWTGEVTLYFTYLKV